MDLLGSVSDLRESEVTSTVNVKCEWTISDQWGMVTHFSCQQKEERIMLEDTKAALTELDKVTVYFRQLEDECLVASKLCAFHRVLSVMSCYCGVLVS